MDDYPAPTPSSIEAAKRQQQIDRAAVTLATGIVIRDDGTMVLNRKEEAHDAHA